MKNLLARGADSLGAFLVALSCLLLPAISYAGDFGNSPDPLASPLPGKLVIVGGGDTPDEVRTRFVELAGGKDARIVVIPTASDLADSADSENRLDVWRDMEVADVTVLHTRSREVANDPEFVKPLEEATGVWFTGGKQSRVMEAYHGTQAETAIRAVFEKGGVIGGTSAGAAIMSAVMILRGNPEVEVGEGFGFLPGTVIDQHFLKRNRQNRLINVVSTYPDLIGLGIDEDTAVIVEGQRLSVVGDSQVVTCLPPTSDHPAELKVLKAGDEVNLATLSQAARKRK